MYSVRGGYPGSVSTSKVGISSGQAAEFAPASVDGRFGKANSWRWRPGQSGNPSGRPRKQDHVDLWSRVVDHTALLHDLQQRLRPTRDCRFQRFRVFYEFTGNAYRSALLAGYSPKTSKSKSYSLARKAKENPL
jgi:hypothetical protein